MSSEDGEREGDICTRGRDAPRMVTHCPDLLHGHCARQVQLIVVEAVANVASRGTRLGRSEPRNLSSRVRGVESNYHDGSLMLHELFQSASLACRRCRC
jgi:hypothetical protein